MDQHHEIHENWYYMNIEETTVFKYELIATIFMGTFNSLSFINHRL